MVPFLSILTTELVFLLLLPLLLLLLLLLLLRFNTIALRTAKTLWSFGRSECSRVKQNFRTLLHVSFISFIRSDQLGRQTRRKEVHFLSSLENIKTWTDQRDRSFFVHLRHWKIYEHCPFPHIIYLDLDNSRAPCSIMISSIMHP